MRNLSILLFVTTLVFCNFSQSSERFEFYTGVRQMGMGGAGIAVVNDETALLTNPAGLGRLRNQFLTFVDPEIHYGSENSNIFPGAEITNSFTIQGVLNALNENKDKYYHMRYTLFPSFVVPNFGMGILSNTQTSAEVATGDATPTDDVFHLDFRNDTAFVLGYNFRLFSGRLKFGFNIRYINRVEVRDQDPAVSPSEANLEIKNIGDEGAGIASDVGMVISAPWKLLPTLAVVARDVGNTSFTLGNGFLYGISENRPQVVQQTIDAGFSLHPIIGNRTRMTITAEMRDVTDVQEETDSAKRIHAGFEFNFRDVFFFRGGMNQRYWTAGLEFAINHVQLQLASYGEEVGTAEVNREDRRYVFKFAYRF